MNLTRHIGIVAVTLLALTARTFAGEKPNFVIVIGDDHGVYHSMPYGAEEIQTPNMQTMADEGIRLTNAYVASPACAPSRAALFTGLMPYRNGVVGNHEAKLKPGVESLIPRLIKQGYDIVWRGKVGHFNQRAPYYIPEVTVLDGKIKPLDLTPVAEYLAKREKPFRPIALFVGCHYPHRPWPKPEKPRISPEDVVVPPKTYDTPETRSEMTRYVEAVESVDRTIGQVREIANKHLDPKNTLLMYTSDHGQAWPFSKWSLYETGIRTPLLAVWPGKIAPGTTNPAMVSWIDIMPTLIDLAGGTVPDGIDGHTIAPVLFGQTTKHRDRIFATHKGDLEWNVYPIRSVRVGEWKYIRNLHPEFYYTTHMDLVKKGSPFYNCNWPSWISAATKDPAAAAFLRAYHSRPAEELYRIDEDPFEKTNFADDPKHQAVLKELRGLVTERMKTVGDDQSLSGEPRLLKDHPLPTVPDSRNP